MRFPRFLFYKSKKDKKIFIECKRLQMIDNINFLNIIKTKQMQNIKREMQSW